MVDPFDNLQRLYLKKVGKVVETTETSSFVLSKSFNEIDKNFLNEISTLYNNNNIAVSNLWKFAF